MIQAIAKNITRTLVKQNIIEFDDYSVYLFGMEMIVLAFSEVILLLMLGLVLGKILEVFVFLVCFAVLRSYAGGVHLNSALMCLTLFTTLAFFAVYSVSITPMHPVVVLIECLLSLILVFRYAPIQSPNRPLSSSEINVFEKKSRQVALLFSIILIAASLFNKYTLELSIIGSHALLFESITLFPFLNKKVGVSNETGFRSGSKNG